jgi:5-methylthioribose kinase
VEGLSAADAARFAVDNGLVQADEIDVAPLSGGVSNDTLLVTDGRSRVVVKRALGRLRTELEWHASPRRAVEEAIALQAAADLTPEAVPPVLAVDTATATIALAAAPNDWADWKCELLAGRVDPAVGAHLGAVLASWHRRTTNDPPLRDRLPDLDRMDALRIKPFHYVVARRHPDLATTVHGAAEELRSLRLCLTHGDFSPKNVLVGEDGLWVIDFEVAHIGNPVFDVAFLQAHLLLKAIAHRPSGKALVATAEAFTGAYGTPVASMEDLHLPLHTGCLVLARVDGTSPVHYLTDSDILTARALGRDLVKGSLDLQSAWKQVCSG